MITKQNIGSFMAGIAVPLFILMVYAEGGNIIELDFIDWQMYGLAGASFLVAAGFMFFWERK